MPPDQYQFPDEVEAAAAKAQVAKPAEPEVLVEIADDTPAEDKNRKPLDKPLEAVAPTDEEAKQYSETVQKRFRELTHLTHDERRAKEAAQRERDEAARIAKQLWEDNQRLQQYVARGEKIHKEAITSASDSELTLAKKALSAAYSAGDADKVAEATQALNQATIRAEIARQFQPTQIPAGQPQNFQLPSTPVQQAPTNPAPAVDPRAAQWQARNQWFGADPELTSFALGFHKKLIDGGVDPTSDEYYQKVDSRMKEKFPEYFGPSSTPSAPAARASVVAPVGRTPGPRKVTLSTSQQALAKRLGITTEQYAKQLVALEKQQNG